MTLLTLHTVATPPQGNLLAIVEETPDSVALLRDAVADKYTVERQVGHGGMANVYLARDRDQNRVAIKLFHRHLATHVGVKRFLAEIDVTRRLQHPNIVRFIASGDAEGLPYFLMEYIEGETLSERMHRDGQLPLKDAVAICADVVEALDYAHGQQVVHRDITPRNILLSDRGAVVADFGIAKALDEDAERLTSTGVRIGVPGYMSPEQCAGERGIDRRSDIYSLGCVLYEMLAGEPVFHAGDANALLNKTVTQPAPLVRVLRPSLPIEIEEVVQKALAKSPADRYLTARAFISALRAAARTQWRPPAPVRIGVLAGGTALAVGAIVSVGWRVLAGSQSPSLRLGELDPARIAVLYFQDQTGGALAHVARGLTEDLIDELAQVQSLHVLSPEAVQQYRPGVPLDSLAHVLAVGTVVTGRVDSSGGKVRVTTRLSNAATGELLATHTGEQEWQHLLDLEDELVDNVARFLRVRLGTAVVARQKRAKASNVDAWSLVQLAETQREDAYSLWRRGQSASAATALEAADTILIRAGRRAPRWAEPIMRRGWVAVDRARIEGAAAAQPGARLPVTGASDSSWLEAAVRFAEVATEHEGELADILELRGTANSRLARLMHSAAADSLMRVAERDLREAITQRPGAVHAWVELSTVLSYRGDFGGAAKAAVRAVEADAFLTESQRTLNELFTGALRRGEFDEAKTLCASGKKHYPTQIMFIECELTASGWSSAAAGDVERGWSLLREIERDSSPQLAETWGYRRLMISAVAARAGLTDSARSILANTHQVVARLTPRLLNGLTFTEAYVHVLAGDTGAALGLLGPLLESQPQRRSYVAGHPWFASLRGNPTFESLVTRR